MDAFTEAAEAAKAVWQDTVTLDPPMSVEERLDAVLEAHKQALAASGCLIVPELAPTAEELDSAAKWLAEQSDFPRYWAGRDEAGQPVHDGWRELRDHPRHVEVAFTKAKNRITAGDGDHLLALVTARRMLTNACAHAAGSH